MQIEWGQTRAFKSWHTVRYALTMRAQFSLCGRILRDDTIRDILPAGRSCESCLRIVARHADKET